MLLEMVCSMSMAMLRTMAPLFQLATSLDGDLPESKHYIFALSGDCGPDATLGLRELLTSSA